MKYKKTAIRVGGVYHIPCQDNGTRTSELERRFSEYPKTTIYHATK